MCEVKTLLLQAVIVVFRNKCYRSVNTARAQFDIFRTDLTLGETLTVMYLRATNKYTLIYFIRTSKFWPSLVVLKFLHNLSLNCS